MHHYHNFTIALEQDLNNYPKLKSPPYAHFLASVPRFHGNFKLKLLEYYSFQVALCETVALRTKIHKT